LTVFKTIRFDIAGVLAATLFLMPAIGTVSPKAMVPLLLISLVAVAAIQITKGGPKSMPSPLLATGLAIFLLWAALGLTWAPIPLPAGFSILSLTALIIAGMVFLWLIPTTVAGAEKVANWCLTGYATANLIIAFEAISGNWISRRVRGLEWRDIISIEGIGENLDAFLNNGIVILALLVWPVITILNRRRQWAWTIVALALIMGVAFYFRHSASLLAVLAGLVAWGMGRISRVWTARLLALGFVVMVLASPFLMERLTRGVDLHSLANSEFGRRLPQSIIPRLFIWDFAAKKSLERPVLGWGMNASRLIPGGGEKFIVYDARVGSGKIKQLYNDSLLPLHPHNQAIQIWLELGGVGAAIVALFGGLFLLRLRFLAPAEATLFGMIVSYLVFALSSFGAWQNWWIATLFLGAALWRTTGRERLGVPA